MANSKKAARREAMGDSMGMSVAPQPNPGLPQGPGNVMNRPASDMNGQMGMPMNTGGPGSNYGDLQMDAQQSMQMGSIGFVGNSGQPQNLVPGRGQNIQAPYNAQPQPDPQQQMMMEPMYDFESAQGLTMPNGLNNGQPVSYNVTALGPTGFPMENGVPVPGAFPAQMSAQREGTLGLQGMQSAEAAVGMNTGRGGGRDKGKN